MATFGVTIFPTDYAISPMNLATAVEARGLDSLFFNSSFTKCIAKAARNLEC
jgi:hypothetical protein